MLTASIMTFKKMLFTLLWLAGMVGVLSTLLMDLPIPKEEVPIPMGIAKLLNLITPTFLLSIAVLVGVNCAHRVGLSAPLAEAFADALPKVSAIQPQILPGLLGGALGGIVVSAWFPLWRSILPSDFISKAEEFSRNTPILTRILYGGITEEIMIRWGLMSFLVWLAWRLLQKSQGAPHTAFVVLAIVISAVVFGLGHLPIAFALSSQVTTALILYVVIGNSIFGLIAGYLFWQKGLEAAIMAHMLTHIIAVAIESFKS